nr:hypothetical protein [Tanacetum cinerariifolium]
MSTIHDIKSKLTQKALDALCTKYHIPSCVHPILPGLDQNILQSPDGKVGEMYLFTFIRYSDPTKVRIGGRERAYGKGGDSSNCIDKLFYEGNDDVPEETVAKDVSERLREDHHAASSNTRGKSFAAICELVLDGSSVPSRVTEPPTVVFIPSMPDDGPTNSMFGLICELISCCGCARNDIVVTTTITSNAFAIPPPKVRVVSKNLEIFRDFAFIGGANADAAGFPWGGGEDASEAHFGTKDILEDNCSKQTNLLSERYIEIAHLKSLLSLKEAEAVEAICLLGQISAIEALSRDELSSKVASLESKRDSLVESTFEFFKERMEATQDEQANVLVNRVTELDAQLLEMAAHLDEEFYPRFLTAISRRWWILTLGLKLVLFKCLQSLKCCHALGQAISCTVNKGIQDGMRARVEHGKAGRELSLIKAYDPSTEAKYVKAINSLEGPLAEILRAKDLQPSPQQLRLPIHRPEDNIMEKRLSLTDVMVPLAKPLSSRSLISEASTSAASATSKPVTTLSMTFASSDVVPPLSISNDQVFHNKDLPAMTFKKEELDTSSK